MKGRTVLVIAGAVIALVGMTRATWAINDCTGSCALVGVSSASGTPGGTVHVTLSFSQGPSDGGAGGIDEIAALALTLGMPGSGSGVPLTLGNNCAIVDGLPTAVIPDGALSNFQVVVENASCDSGRTHCLCPAQGSGITPDNFINLVIYGPNPLPTTPPPGGIDIPLLPSGALLTIDLTVAPDASGTIPLHLFNQVIDGQNSRPAFTALLSVGDKTAVDQTCGSAIPPCGDLGGSSKVGITDGSVQLPNACVGDCNGNGVTIDELMAMLDIALGNGNILACSAGSGGDGMITVDDILKAENNALNACQ